MGVEYRKQRRKWGFRKYCRGRSYAQFRWETKAEADAAYRKFVYEELEPLQNVGKNALVTVVNDFLVYSMQQGRSKWRVQGLRYSFNAIIVPWFGATTALSAIGVADVNRFICEQVKRVKPSTVWHYSVDLSTLFNYALAHEPPLALENPVKRADKRPFRNRKFIKPELDPADVERAAAALQIADRIYFDHLRYTGCRKDEGNRTEWKHLNLDQATVIIPGTKTDESLAIVPIPPEHAAALAEWRKLCPSDRWAFPSCDKRSTNRGKQTYHRERMFKRIKKLTGIKLTPKDLRDYFCNEVAARTSNPVLLMDLMRHKSLATTTRYVRRRLDSMRAVVNNLVTNPGNKSESPTGLNIPLSSQKIGGGEWSRTTDAADMSRVLSSTKH